jgi:hypothetical protein
MFNLSLNLPSVIEPVLSGTMAVLTNPRHEKFAQAVAGGMSAGAAYRKIYKSKPESAETQGPLLLRDVQVSFRVAEIRENANKIAKERLDLTQEEVLAYLARVVRTPIGDVDHTSDLCQERTFIEGNEETSVKVKMVGKLEAIKQVATMCGWNAPQKVENDGKLEIVVRKL